MNGLLRRLLTRPVLAALLELTGVGVVSFGVAMFSLSAGVIVGGAGIVLFGVALDLS